MAKLYVNLIQDTSIYKIDIDTSIRKGTKFLRVLVISLYARTLKLVRNPTEEQKRRYHYTQRAGIGG